MVIGERFAWAHLPKSGGTATNELFRLFPDLVVHQDTDDGNEKHTLFRDRKEQIAGKALALNLRRLPFWVLSRAQHVSRWGIHPDYTPIPMQSPRALSESSFPDSRIALYTDDGRLQIDRWIRMESLCDDFLKFISEWTDVSAEQEQRTRAVAPVNLLAYDHTIEHWFTPAQVASMYSHNPVWAALEEELYGDIFRL